MLARALAALASLSAASAAGSGGGKSVNAELKSGWASTPLDLEAAEFAASASGNEAFWEVVALGGEGFAALPDEARYKAVGAHVAETLGDAGAALLDISLSAREFSPIVAILSVIVSVICLVIGYSIFHHHKNRFSDLV